MRTQYNFATWIRSFGVVAILLCHFVEQNSNPYLQMSAQLFNIGVEIFFILSGFLFGTRLSCAGGVFNCFLV